MWHQRGAPELGEAEGSSPHRPCFLYGALPRFGILPAFSDCPAVGKKNSHFSPCVRGVGVGFATTLVAITLGAAGQLGTL